MRFKIDENLPVAFAMELRAAGHEAHTVRDESLEGATDDVVLAACDREARALVTEDVDFANVVAYPPERHHGVIVMRTRQQGLGALAAFRRLVLPNLTGSLAGKLWIVEDDQIRVHSDVVSAAADTLNVDRSRGPADRLAIAIARLEQLAQGWAVEYARGLPVVAWNRVVLVEEPDTRGESLRDARVWTPQEYAARFADVLRESRCDWINLTAEGVLDDALVIVVVHRWDQPIVAPPMFVHIMACGPQVGRGFVRFSR